MNFKKILFGQKDLMSIGFANLLGTGIGAIFWFYLATLVSPDEYGQIHYFLGIAAMGQLFSLIATPNAVTVYVAKNIKIHSTLFFISFLAGIISSIIIFLIFFRFDVSLLVLCYIIFEFANGFLLGKKIFSTYSKFFLAQKILTVIFGLGFFFLFGFEWIILGLSLSFIPYIWIIVKEFRITKINFALLKPRKGFIINNYGLNISSAVGAQIDKIIIVPILGFELLGNYSLAMQFLVILFLFPTIVFKYVLTQDASNLDTGNLKKFSILGAVVLTAIGIIVLPTLISILFPKFIDATIAIQIMSLGIIPATIGIFYESKLLSLEKGKFPVISKSIGVVVLISGFLILGPIYGIIGLSVMVVISSLSETVFIIIASRTLNSKT